MPIDLGSENIISKSDIVEESDKLTRHGVYFLIENGEIIYVGSSKYCCESRVQEHYERSKSFDSHTIIPVDRSIYLKEMEARFIYKFLPRENCDLPFHGTISNTKEISKDYRNGIGRSKIEKMLKESSVKMRELFRSNKKLVKRKPAKREIEKKLHE